ncbi:hypothetical protein TrRE_jg5152 [Triparma retinervis]|uniref:Uncharacterized protein n=1 Tax=Triparma retinervis TaxID=2557542 RepID=A0A9W7FH41_9STRA|nr:hypothetical protein TrRE_jg5152 [Triparma retinervis]
MSTAHTSSFGGTEDDDDLLLLNDDENDTTWDTSDLSGGMDTGVMDTGVMDTGVMDTGVMDTGVMDTGASSGSLNKTNSGSTSNNGGGRQAANKTNPGLCWCFKVASYQPYFDVDTVDVLERMIESLKFWKNPTAGDVGHFKSVLLLKGGPDAYGPFWISMTLP